jgi:hypothetical protein
MVKILENIYRSVNIALINELKLLSQRMGLNIWEIVDAAKTKPFGFQAFYPGPGPRRALHPDRSRTTSRGRRSEFDFSTRFIELAGESQHQHAVRGGLAGGGAAERARNRVERGAAAGAGAGLQEERGRLPRVAGDQDL